MDEDLAEDDLDITDSLAPDASLEGEDVARMREDFRPGLQRQICERKLSERA